MFRVSYVMGANLCLVLLTRDVKTASHQLLPEEEMAPNAGKHCGSIFLFVQNHVVAHIQSMKIPAIIGKSGN